MSFNWSHTAERYWPRRLLLVEGNKLTSLEKAGHCTYGDFHSPSYNILSYTWGRWEVAKGRSLLIHNVPWEIPVIDPLAFTVEAFSRAVQRAARGCRFIWLDIACIDQKDYAIKMDEIGHQAAIFRGAEEAYIWLHRTPLELLSEYIIGNHGAELYSDIWLERRLLCMNRIFDDPWFSSTWTLQEAFLRTNATLIMGDANFLRIQNDGGNSTPLRLKEVLYACYTNNQALQLEMTYCKHILSTSRISLVEAMLNIMRQVGALCLYENNAVELYAASTNRTACNQHDRIYGIMQVFGFVLGTARVPHKTFTLEALEDELGSSINLASPTIAQMFVHMADCRPFRSWCMHPGIRIPTRAYNIRNPTDLCSISFEPIERIATFRGHRAPFEQWLKFCRDVEANQRADIEGTYPWIQLDRTCRNISSFPIITQASLYTWQGIPESLFEPLGLEYDSCLQVLQIGKWEDFEYGGVVNKHAGIICYPIGNPSSFRWVRIGICIWKLPSGAEGLSRSQRIFFPGNLILG